MMRSSLPARIKLMVDASKPDDHPSGRICQIAPGRPPLADLSGVSTLATEGQHLQARSERVEQGRQSVEQTGQEQESHDDEQEPAQNLKDAEIACDPAQKRREYIKQATKEQKRDPQAQGVDSQ